MRGGGATVSAGQSLSSPAGHTQVQLLVWSHEPMQRMLAMTQLVRSCAGLKGGALSVGIHRHEGNGDPDVSTYVRHLLRQALSPLFEMIRRRRATPHRAPSHPTAPHLAPPRLASTRPASRNASCMRPAICALLRRYPPTDRGPPAPRYRGLGGP